VPLPFWGGHVGRLFTHGALPTWNRLDCVRSMDGLMRVLVCAMGGLGDVTGW
jgi:hypothetical protein